MKIDSRMKVAVAALGAVVMACSAQQASANSYEWKFTDAGGTVDASGWLTTSPPDNGGFDVNKFGGIVSGPNSGTITMLGVVPANNNGVPTALYQPGYATDPSDFGAAVHADNILYPSTNPALDVWGIGFYTGNTLWNVFGNGAPGADILIDSVGGSTPDNYIGTFSISPAPEPATWAMLILGLAMIGYAARRRSSSIASTIAAA
jgi:hypothetical protein